MNKKQAIIVTLVGIGFLAAAFIGASGCAGNAPPGTTPTVNLVADYGVRITKAATGLQQTLAASGLPDDVKAQGMVKFREAGVVIEKMGRGLKIYDAAIKAGQPPPAEGDGQIDNIISMAEEIYALVLGAVPNLGEYKITLDLIQQAVTELRKHLGRTT